MPYRDVQPLLQLTALALTAWGSAGGGTSTDGSPTGCANVTAALRVACGYDNMPYKCYNNDCCFDAIKPNPHDYPWCFHKPGWRGPAPPPPRPPKPLPPAPPPAPGQCSNATAGRHDCGHARQPAECLKAGCCWDEISPNLGLVVRLPPHPSLFGYSVCARG